MYKLLTLCRLEKNKNYIQTCVAESCFLSNLMCMLNNYSGIEKESFKQLIKCPKLS